MAETRTITLTATWTPYAIAGPVLAVPDRKGATWFLAPNSTAPAGGAVGHTFTNDKPLDRTLTGTEHLFLKGDGPCRITANPYVPPV